MKQWKRRALAAVLTLVLAAGASPAGAITVEQARALILERYVDQVPAAALEQDTVEATVDALGDPYSWYLTPEELAEMLDTDVDQTIVGIGVTMTAHEDGFEILRVEETGPAKEAGLAAGDVVTAVDGVSLQGLDPETISGMVRGEEGTSVRLTYRRDGRSRTVRVTRRAVVIAATRGELLEGGIGYIQCDEFGSDTAGHFRTLIRRMDQDANVWVIDLRGNPGGTVDAVSEVGCLFAGPGAYVLMRDKGGETAAYGLDEEAITGKPVVILTDEDSASAAEALTAALRDYGRAVVIGERTFGKGIAQELIHDLQYPEYFPDGDGIKLTVARFFSPGGNTNDALGVIPELNVDPAAALELVKRLAPTWSGEECADPLMFSLYGQWYTLELAGLEKDETGRALLKVLLDALPRPATLARQGSMVSIDALYRAFGLEDGHWEFPDGDDGTYCDASIYDALYTYDLVAGKDDGLFHPQDALTRAELCQLVAAALQCRYPTNASPFDDVDDAAWYAPAVIALYNRGMVQGDGNGLFHPEAEVSHQEFFAVMGRLLAWLNCGADDALDAVGEEELSLRILRDYDSWAKAPVWLLACGLEEESGASIDLLWDYAEDIDPHAATTRDEAALVLYQMLNCLGIV